MNKIVVFALIVFLGIACSSRRERSLSGKEITKTEFLDAPPHQPGLLPKFLGEYGANLIITGGMGQKAVDGLDIQQPRIGANEKITLAIFENHNFYLSSVVTGIPVNLTPKMIFIRRRLPSYRPYS